MEAVVSDISKLKEDLDSEKLISVRMEGHINEISKLKHYLAKGGKKSESESG